PDGFYGDKYYQFERSYKLDAHNLMLKSLHRESFNSLLAAGDHDDICSRALAVVNKTNLIFPNEKMSLGDGLKTDFQKQLFSESLYELLYGEGTLETRFNRFCDCLLEIRSAKWPVATYFLFITFPTEHMFLKPEVTQSAAAICNFELNYRSEP